MKLLLNASSFSFGPKHRSELLAACPGLEVTEQVADSVDALDGRDVAVLVTEQIPRELQRWPQLRWIQLLSAGANQLRNHPIADTSIQVTTASGTHGVPIAQYVTCTLLMMAHRMPELLAFKATRVWPDRLSLGGFPVRGLTAGIIGYGSIGRECARQLNMLGLRIVCLKRDPATRQDAGYNAWPGVGDPQGSIPAAWYSPSQLSAMLPECDVLVVTAPATPQTDGMIGVRELGLLKRGARLIIVSRGGIVAESALADALRSGQIAEAVVDCYSREPLPSNHPFFDLPNLIMTPHMSGVYDEFWSEFVRLLAANIIRFKTNQPLLNLADARHGY